jgi:phosphatidylglycerophosphate synthase
MLKKNDRIHLQIDDLNHLGFVLFAVATVLTVWSGITYVLKNKQVLVDKKD